MQVSNYNFGIASGMDGMMERDYNPLPDVDPEPFGGYSHSAGKPSRALVGLLRYLERKLIYLLLLPSHPSTLLFPEIPLIDMPMVSTSSTNPPQDSVLCPQDARITSIWAHICTSTVSTPLIYVR